MNKTAIKNFAIRARNKLIAEITYKAGLLGITGEGIKTALPQSGNGTEYYDIGTKEPYAITGAEIKQRQDLVTAIKAKQAGSDYKSAYEQIIDEVAYTWFNRLIAIRFMEVNDYLPSRIRVLSSVSGKNEPDIVTTPFEADMEYTDAERTQIIGWKNDEKLDEAFRYLFLKQCNELNEVLPALFEKVSDYTELLLTVSFTDKDGVVYHLVHDISEDDFNVEIGGQVEIIGWMYQYYNTEPKDKVFADLKKNIKISKENIPAATQLFTPDWIVRYMVENSLGRIFSEQCLVASGQISEEERIAKEQEIANKMGWKYYLPEAAQEPGVRAQLNTIHSSLTTAFDIENIKCIDPCMGSGHILCYFFDVLMQIYESQGYSERDAAQSILEHNIWGLDIDERAAQLAYFSVMMKARQYDRRILTRGIQPHVYAIVESNGFNRAQLKYFGATLDDFARNNALNQVNGLLEQLYDAEEYGSILTVDQMDWPLLREFAEHIAAPGQLDLDSIGVEDTQAQLKKLIAVGEVLAQKYSVTCTNPPYMGNNGMGDKLGIYLKNKFPDSKGDLFAVFIEACGNMTAENGFQAMITQHAWMFLSSYENLRNKIQQKQIINMAHLGPRAFDEISGEVVQTTTFVLKKAYCLDYIGTYVRLTGGTSELAKRDLFLLGEQRFFKSQRQFAAIQGIPFTSYWASNTVLKAFKTAKLVGDVSEPRVGMATANNDRFIRLWSEVVRNKFGHNLPSREAAVSSKKKWFPFAKGGEQRKWYGNNDYVVNWENDGLEIQNFKDEKTGRIRSHNYNLDYIFSSALTWTVIGTEKTSFRFCPVGFLYSNSGYGMFCNDEDVKHYLLAFMNSKIAATLLQILSPSMGFESGYLRKLPIIIGNDKSAVVSTGKRCIDISKCDWDSFETSWDFQQHPLV